MWDEGFFVADYDTKIPGSLKKRGKQLSFGKNRDFWRHRNFLEFHNMRFVTKMKVAAESNLFYERGDSDKTLALDDEEINRLKQQDEEWIEEQSLII